MPRAKKNNSAKTENFLIIANSPKSPTSSQILNVVCKPHELIYHTQHSVNVEFSVDLTDPTAKRLSCYRMNYFLTDNAAVGQYLKTH